MSMKKARDEQNITRRLSQRTNMNLNNYDNEIQEKLREPEPVQQRNMNELINKSLVIKDPHYGKNCVYFSYQEKIFKEIEQEQQFLEILNVETSILQKDDKQFLLQLDYHKRKATIIKKAKKEGAEMKEKESDSIRSLRNQLTFSERTSQSINPDIISREVETVKLRRNNHSGIMHKWDLFDKYVNKFIAIAEEERIRQYINEHGRNPVIPVKKKDENPENLNKPSLLRTLKLVERQIMQILNFDQYHFYREWNKIEESNDSKLLIMLLPFPQNASIRNRSVTSICWNPNYEDLFAVGYGSYAFPKKKDEKEKGGDDREDRSDDILESGYIFVYSIKNNYYPEVKYTTESGVLSLDFHPVEISLLVAGMYDGTVSVFDISQKIKTPIIHCDIRTQRHMDPVWQVKWYKLALDNQFCFFSISSDGKVNKWSFFKNKAKLELENMVTLKYSDSQNELYAGKEQEGEIKEKEDGFVFGNAGGMCFDFNKHKGKEHLFVLGTEEGHIHLCSAKHRGHFIQTFEGHTMGVYTVTWNPFHTKIFASCSADWTIKIWHYRIFAPLIIFDMQNAVGDVAWSPWCSTIFAAVTIQGDMKFFDLNRNRKSAIHEKKLHDIPINHLAFNKFEYVFVTGNEKGKVRLWRMADSLRTTIDKKEEEAKEKAKAAANNQKSSNPETKVNVPKNLLVAVTKTKKVVEIKKDNKQETVNSKEYVENEAERITEFLRLLDIDDTEDD
jgi:dynein intermediate chain 1